MSLSNYQDFLQHFSHQTLLSAGYLGLLQRILFAVLFLKKDTL
jgi:hypothetical protein